MFRFRTIDLFLITAIVAVVAGAQQVELFFFRQLLWFSLVGLFSTTTVIAVSGISQKRILGGLGGLMAGCFYYALTIGGDWMFDSNAWSSGPNRFLETSFVFIFSFPLGFAIGPLIAIHFREPRLAKEFERPFRYSIGLLAATLVVAYFTMLDRLRHETRDWTFLLVLLSIAFVVYTAGWLKRVELTDNPLKDGEHSDKLESQ